MWLIQSELNLFSATTMPAKSSQQLLFLFQYSFLYFLLKSLCVLILKVLSVLGCRLQAWVTVKVCLENQNMGCFSCYNVTCTIPRPFLLVIWLVCTDHPVLQHLSESDPILYSRWSYTDLSHHFKKPCMSAHCSLSFTSSEVMITTWETAPIHLINSFIELPEITTLPSILNVSVI